MSATADAGENSPVHLRTRVDHLRSGQLSALRSPHPPRRVAMLSMHTSPLEQPGTGDAGGMNVYVVELARRLARQGTTVEIFTRATRSDQPAVTELDAGVLVRHVAAGPFEGLLKEDLPGQLCAFAAGVLRAEASRERGFYDVVHSHYWLSGQVGLLAAERWGVPLVHSMHTMAAVKNAALSPGDRPEPRVRELGERHLAANADRLIANTDEEAQQLADLYGAQPDRISVASPGVDLDVFCPGDQASARADLGLAADAQVLLFVGRIQPLKAPEVLVAAVARMLAVDPSLRRRLVVLIVGGPSGSGMDEPCALATLADELGVSDVMRWEKPVDRSRLPQFYRAADLTVVPSRSESFGLVAVESQACGTPVVAERVGGLRISVADGRSGVLVDGHDPGEWARTLSGLLADPAQRARLSAGARSYARRFGWDATAESVQEAYARTLRAASAERLQAV